MREKKKHGVIRMLFAVLLLCVVMATPTAAAETDDWKTVRVACDINKALYLNEEGKPEGYCSEYLIQLAKIEHWNLEYLPASWNESVQNLYDGKIDLLFPTQMTEDRVGKMGFSSAIGGYQPISLFARTDSELCYDDYKAFDGKKIAISAGTSNEESMNAYAQRNGFSYQPVYLNTIKEKEEALADGTVDMMVFSTLNNTPDAKVVAMLDYLPFYYCTNIENTALLYELNDGMNQMLLRHPDIVQDVFCDFFSAKLSFAYTAEEQQDIKSHGKVLVGVYEDTDPLFGIAADGTYHGIYKDIIERIKELSGLELEIKPLSRKEVAFDYLEEGTIDFVLGSSDQALLYSGEKGFVQSESVMDYYTISITRGDYHKTDADPVVVALTMGRRFWETEILKKNPNASFIYYLSSKECLNAVRSGKADLTLLNSWEYNYQSKNQKFEDLMEWENSRTLSDSVFISQEGECELIRSVLNKAIEQISNPEKEQIITANLNRPYDSYDFSDRLYEARGGLLIFGSILLIVFVGVGIFIIMRRRSVQELEEKNKQLRTANEAKDNFLSRMSHELRTPLNALYGYAELTQEDIRSKHPDTDRQLHNLAHIREASRYLLRIIDDILEMQNPDNKKIAIHKIPVNAEGYIGIILDEISKEAKEKGVSFEVERLTHLNEAYMMDEIRCGQVIMNVLHNAVKFTPQGGSVKMTVEARPLEGDLFEIKAVVSDTGIGMSREFIDKYLFTNFAQENQSIDSPYSGCGVGLALCKVLLDAMDGTISCTSEKDNGSVFTITIKTEAAKQDKEIQTEKKQEQAGYILPGIRILLCEDNKINQEIEKRLLERMHCMVDIAEDGQVGVAKFAQSEQGHYNIVLMDIRMPNMDGLEATRKIRELKREDAKTVPILAVSANAFEEDVKASLESGMNEHLAKPVDGAILYEKLKRYCAENQ